MGLLVKYNRGRLANARIRGYLYLMVDADFRLFFLMIDVFERLRYSCTSYSSLTLPRA